ncbi:MAG: PilT protein [Ignavibacteria bacterium]|nr:PilT protein [Ignavibacteria bacterium]
MLGNRKINRIKKIRLPVNTKSWFDSALNYPGIQLLPLTPEIALESTELPGMFHKDPAD